MAEMGLDTGFGVSVDPSSGSFQGTPRRLVSTVDFEDRRDELHRNGHIKWRVEQGVPDVGGLGWKAKSGHVLKNQTYYNAKPYQNLWDNPAHAGPKTWKDFHGPRLRTDADLMSRLERLEVEQEEWEGKKAFQNAVRVQTLDRFYSHKVENEQKAIAPSWAPHRRTRKEYSNEFDRFDSEIDSMPMKELKKVLTPAVLRADRNAIRMISQRLQTEETWKLAWKAMEEQRHDECREDLHHRMAYTDMISEMSGQPPRAQDPYHQIPNRCTPRVEELAKAKAAHEEPDVTRSSDFRGLVHVDNHNALEARFPGYGHELAATFKAAASVSARPGWPPPPRPDTPDMHATKTQARPSLTPRALAIKRGSIPVSQHRIEAAGTHRTDNQLFMQPTSEQYLRNAPPPAPDQRNMHKVPTLVPDAQIMGVVRSRGNAECEDFGRYGSSDGSGSPRRRETRYAPDKPPDMHPITYPVLVTVEKSVQAVGVEVRKEVVAAARRQNPHSKVPLTAREVRDATRRQRLAAETNGHTGREAASELCKDMDTFEANLPPKPAGNFWMTPRSIESTSRTRRALAVEGATMTDEGPEVGAADSSSLALLTN